MILNDLIYYILLITIICLNVYEIFYVKKHDPRFKDKIFRQTLYFVLFILLIVEVTLFSVFYYVIDVFFRMIVNN